MHCHVHIDLVMLVIPVQCQPVSRQRMHTVSEVPDKDTGKRRRRSFQPFEVGYK